MRPQYEPTDLKIGEWQMFCPTCGFKADKNTAIKSQCPNCKNQLWLAEQKSLAR